jgi:DNA-binding NarL/FixJ family response regulator
MKTCGLPIVRSVPDALLSVGDRKFRWQLRRANDSTAGGGTNDGGRCSDRSHRTAQYLIQAGIRRIERARTVTRLLLVLGSSVSSDRIRRLVSSEHDLTVVDDIPESTKDIFSVVEHSAPEILLVDRDLRNSDGIAITGNIVRTRRGRAPSLIVLADFHRRGDAIMAAKAGARGYLVKSQASCMLGPAIRAVASGEAWLCPSAAAELLDELGPQRYKAREPLPLTGRELNVIRLVAHGYSNVEAARELGVSESTVKTHVSRMLAKLNLRSRTQLAVFARDAGIA